MDAVFSLVSMILFAGLIIGALAFIGGFLGTGFTPVDDAGERTLSGVEDTVDSIDNATSGASEAEIEAAIHEETNDVRSNQSLPTIEYSDELQGVAKNHSEHMAEDDFFAHDTPGGVGPQERVAQAGLRCTTGENLHYEEGYSTVDAKEVAERVVDGWMNSPGHRRNIVDPAWRVEGVGVERDGRELYVTQLFCL